MYLKRKKEEFVLPAVDLIIFLCTASVKHWHTDNVSDSSGLSRAETGAHPQNRW